MMLVCKSAMMLNDAELLRKKRLSRQAFGGFVRCSVEVSGMKVEEGVVR